MRIQSALNLERRAAGYNAWRAAWVFDPYRPCKQGHVAPTRKKGRQCPICHRLTELARRAKTRKPRIVLVLTDEERRERQNAANRASYHKHKVKRRPYAAFNVARRRAKLRGAGGKHTVADRQFVWKLQRGKCAYAKFELPWCSKELSGNAHWDHIVPLCRGGSNDVSNGQWLCAACNHRKNSQTDLEFLSKCEVQDLFVATIVAQG